MLAFYLSILLASTVKYAKAFATSASSNKYGLFFIPGSDDSIVATVKLFLVH